MIPELENFRKKYPGYNDMDDATLASKLASKYPDAYGDLPDKLKLAVFKSKPESQAKAGQVPEWGIKHPNLYGMAGAARETLGPVAEAAGMIGGAALGASAGPAGGVLGAGLGYGGVRQAIGAADVALGNVYDPGIVESAKRAAIDIPSGAAMEAGGQIIGASAGKIVDAVKSQAPKMYESALKPSTTLKPSVREGRVATALREEIPVSKGGLEKSRLTIKDINKKISNKISDLENTMVKYPTEWGVKISREGALEPVEELSKKVSKESITPQADMGRIAQYIKDVKEAQPNPDIPIQQAQIFKQTLNKELNEYYGHLAKGKVTPEPTLARTKAAMADGLRREITKAFPEIHKLNAREASLIELNKSLGNAVNRITNRELVPLAVQIATGRTSGLLKTIAAKIIDQPYVKSKLAIAISKASTPAYASIAKLGAQSGLLAFNKIMKFPDLESTAEAGTLGDLGQYEKGSAHARALMEAAEDPNSVDIPAATTASERRAVSPSSPAMSESQRKSYDAETERLKAKLHGGGQTQQKAKKPYIPVKMITVQVSDGEEVRYQDAKGNIYKNDPNE